MGEFLHRKPGRQFFNPPLVFERPRRLMGVLYYKQPNGTCGVSPFPELRSPQIHN